MATLPAYASREAVKRALDAAETARNNTRIDDALASARDTINRLLNRPDGLYPTVATRYFDWPNDQSARTWRLWLEEHTLISATTITAGGVAIASTDYFLEPANSGPPFNRLEIDRASSAAFSGGDTPQRSIAIVGVWGHRNVEVPAGALAEALDASETAVDVTNSAAVGVGDLIRVDSERMVVTGKTMLDTGQNLAANLTASNSDQSVSVQSGAVFAIGETILIEAERMLVEEIAGNTLIVRRGWDGTALAAHPGTLDIYAPRTLTVERGALGTTAATHDTAATVNRWTPPSMVRSLAIAEAVTELGAQGAGYAGSQRSGPAIGDPVGGTVDDLRRRVCRAYGRAKYRASAI